MNNRSIFAGLAIVLALMMVTVFGAFIYSKYFEVPYLSYKNVPFTVVGTAVPGGPASAPVIRCSTSDKTESYRTTRNFQKMGANQVAIVLPSVEVTIEPGCAPAVSRINIVPDNSLPGWYRFYGVAGSQGLFVEHKVPWGTGFFEVVAKPPPVAAAAPLVLPIENATVKIEVTK